MKRRQGLSLALFVGFVLVAGPGHAAEALDPEVASAQTLHDTLRVNKQALVAVNLGLTEEEAAAFWPVYEQYQAELEVVQVRLRAVIDEYIESFGNTTDAQADQLVSDYLAVEADHLAIRRKYREPIAEVLPGRKVMRFYQIENKIIAVMRYEIARTIPVIEQ